MRTSPLHFGILMTIGCLSFLPAKGQPAAVISIDLAQPGSALSPSMYGIFFEDINHAADGGLYAELIQNRDFEYGQAPEDMRWIDDSTIVNSSGWWDRYYKPDALHAWALVQEDGARATISLETREPLNSSNPHSMRFDVMNLGHGRAAVVNGGYWGIPVSKGGTYRLSFYARRDPRYKGTLSVSLESTTGARYGAQTISGLTGAWKQFHAILTSGADDPSAQFVLAATSTGTVWFDVVSLFPTETWKNRPQGLRRDLVQMLAGLNPSFVRFPGGCVVEGATLENRFQWKKTIGDIARRPGHWNLWGYRTTDGLGFHEYLQLCEDLRAAPLYVINVGMSCQGRGGMVAPREAQHEYLQEALDALEYAMGPATSRWGAMRKSNGHPAPFVIKFVEVGNENGGPEYREAYKVIQSGLKRAYPGIITIADEEIRLTDEDKKRYPGVSLEMVDEHYYQSPAFFFDQSTRYDRYDRSDSIKIYVGEFAVTSGRPGAGNLRAAIGEAAFMVGMERNADLVRMASYAPTFVNVRDRRWSPDMIVYNTSQVYGTPSYHAMRMFSRNRPDRVLHTTVTVPVDSADHKWAHLRGGIALSAWNTKAEFKDVRVEKNGEALFSEDFSHGAPRWQQVQDQWEVTRGAFTNRRTVVEAIAGVGDTTWTDYTLTLRARKVNGDEGFILCVLRNGENQCLWNIGGWGNSVDVLMQERDGSRVDLGKRRDCTIETGKWYDIRIEVNDGRVRCYLDGGLMHDEHLREQYSRSVYATSGIRDLQGEIVLKIVNPFADTTTCRVDLHSGDGIQPAGEVLVLTSGSPDDENTFGEPERVAPRASVLRNLGESFDYVSPPNSLSILTLKLNR